MNTFNKRKTWSDRFTPEIKRILGETLLSEGTVFEDRHKNTDLTLTAPFPPRISCRVRKNNFLKNYGEQFAINIVETYNCQCELHKIMTGYGDYVFYAFANADETALAQWFIGDLSVFRNWFFGHIQTRNKLPGFIQNSNNGAGQFRCFRLSELPPNFIINANQTLYNKLRLNHE